MPEEFLTEKLSVLDKRIKSFSEGYRQNVAILGDDDEEISYLLDIYLSSHKFQTILYISTQARFVSQKEFFKNVASSLLHNYASSDSFDGLLNAVGPSLPLTVEFIINTIKKPAPPSLLEVLELINKFIHETSRKCVFIIENFLKLKALFPNLSGDFSKFIILQRDCLIVLTGLHTAESEKLLSSELNFLFGNFEKLLLNEGNLSDYHNYLKDLLKPYTPSAFFISFFVNILGFNTLYYDLIKDAIVSNYQKDAEELSIVEALKSALCKCQSYFYQKFMKNIERIEYYFKNYSAVFKILLAISDGYNRRREILSLNILEKCKVNFILKELVDLNCLESLGNLYTIKDPLFAFWLSSSFRLGLVAPLAADTERMGAYEKRIEGTIALFKEDFIKDKVKRILELISSFKDDIFKFGRTTYKLPFVEKVKLLSYPQKRLHYVVCEGKEIVFVGIKEGDVCDADIFEFLEQMSSTKGKGIRKIFIALDRFSTTAKLAAKNSRLIAWDINELNQLLRVYNKPVISGDATTVAEGDHHKG